MSLTDRDRKVLLVIVPLVVLLGYWFLVLSPKRDEASKAGTELSKQEKARDQARSQLSQLESAKTSFAADYSQLVQLGKAIPSSVDMPSLIVQLDRAARGTGIKFKRIATGERQAAPAAPVPAAGSGGAQPAPSTPSGGGATPAAVGAATPPPVGGDGGAAAGGAPAQTGPGRAAENTSNRVNSANAQNQKGADGVTAQDTQTSQPAREGKLAVGGAAGTPAAAGSARGACAPGLECIPLEFELDGRFFRLADFFHRLKRFVKLANDEVVVRGRLLTIDGLKFSSGEAFPALTAEIKATVYLAPKAQGVTAGATSQGPSTTPAAGTAGSAGSQPAPATPPTATANP